MVARSLALILAFCVQCPNHQGVTEVICKGDKDTRPPMPRGADSWDYIEERWCSDRLDGPSLNVPYCSPRPELPEFQLSPGWSD